MDLSAVRNGLQIIIAPGSPLLSGCILGLLSFFLIRGQGRYELLRMEREALVRRYMVFRGKKNSLLHKTQADQSMREDILRSISRSWHNFKKYHAQKTGLLEGNYRWMKRGLLLVGLLLLMSTVRDGVNGLMGTSRITGFLSGILYDVPHYILVIVGIVLLHLQRQEVYGTASNQRDPALEALFSDFDQEDDPFLYSEFDPLEGETREG